MSDYQEMWERIKQLEEKARRTGRTAVGAIRVPCLWKEDHKIVVVPPGKKNEKDRHRS